MLNNQNVIVLAPVNVPKLIAKGNQNIEAALLYTHSINYD
jgi:hypothetical protein